MVSISHWGMFKVDGYPENKVYYIKVSNMRIYSGYINNILGNAQNFDMAPDTDDIAIAGWGVTFFIFLSNSADIHSLSTHLSSSPYIITSSSHLTK